MKNPKSLILWNPVIFVLVKIMVSWSPKSTPQDVEFMGLKLWDIADYVELAAPGIEKPA